MMNLQALRYAPQDAGEHAAFRADVLAGLSARSKSLPAKYFYDAAGSLLFDAITRLDEYYPTRTETALLKRHAGEIAAMAGTGASIVEFGAGSLAKIRILLDALDRPRLYVPIDVSAQYLTLASAELRRDFPHLDVQPVIADFAHTVYLPTRVSGRVLGFFPGSTIGNFERRDAKLFLQRAARTLGRCALFLVGVDTRKDRNLLERAYNDRKGVTAAFNLNLLARINRELGADFDLSAFAHRAFYNERRGRVEMHLESLKDQTVRIGASRFEFVRGATIHTENSYKYAPGEFAALAESAGWRLERIWAGENEMFAVYLLRTR